MPEISLGKTMEKPNFWKLPVHAGGVIYTVFDEESGLKVRNAQFRQPGSKIWKTIIFKKPVFLLILVKKTVGPGPGLGLGPGDVCMFSAGAYELRSLGTQEPRWS